MKWDEKTAIREIDGSHPRDQSAAIDDGKNLATTSPRRPRRWTGPAASTWANELLHKADKDIHEEEDNNFAREMQKRAAHHIGEAIRFTEQGIAHAHH